MWHYLLVVAAAAAAVAGHGRVLSPPGRSSAWRYNFDTPPNYDDDGLNCGGYWRQHYHNGGRCGVCGDPWDMKTPRDNELGGKYGLGIIVADYRSGETITVVVQITAHHKGYWEFKLCADPTRNDQACFDENLLELKDGSTKYYPSSAHSKFEVDYKLPTGLTCDHCVLQWRYIAGNNWGVCANGTEGLGCGNQEQFGACSDISIRESTDDSLTPLEVSEPDNSIDAQDSYEQIPYACLQYLKGYLHLNPGLIQICKNYVRGTTNNHRQQQYQPSQYHPQYNKPQYTQPQYNQPQYQQPQYNQPQYQQPQLYITPTTVYSGYNNYNSLVPKIDTYEEKNKRRIQALKKKLHKRKEMMAAQKWR